MSCHPHASPDISLTRAFYPSPMAADTALQGHLALSRNGSSCARTRPGRGKDTSMHMLACICCTLTTRTAASSCKFRPCIARRAPPHLTVCKHGRVEVLSSTKALHSVRCGHLGRCPPGMPLNNPVIVCSECVYRLPRAPCKHALAQAVQHSRRCQPTPNRFPVVA